jgi:enamine deaminase RidA (YjgF/YER057c/UK114 family)
MPTGGIEYLKERQLQIKRYDSGKRMSQAVVHGGLAFLAGQVADDTTQDVKGQTAQILTKIDRLLAKVGSDKTKILSASIWLASHTSYNDVNEIWDAWVPEGEAPARACVESKPAQPQYTVEIGMIAVV